MKILTRRTADEVGDQWLSEEDTKSFRELLINLLVKDIGLGSLAGSGCVPRRELALVSIWVLM